MCYLPIALLNFIVGIVSIAHKFTTNFNHAVWRDSFALISVKHYMVLAIVYSFGYLVPTIRLIQMKDGKDLYNFVVDYGVRCLSLDLLFTTLISGALIQRNMIAKENLVVPIVLVIFAFYFNDHVTLKSDTPLSTLDNRK